MLKYIKLKLRSFIDKNQFSPSFAGLLVNPFWLSRRELSIHFKKYAPALSGAILDFGCGTAPYKQFVKNATSYLGLEYDSDENRKSKSADIFYDGNTIPLNDESIDGIISTQTFEHVPNPAQIVSEWKRILKPDGKLLLTVPFMWPEHEMPNDFLRYTSGGICSLLSKNGFEIMVMERLLCDLRTPAQLFLAYMYDNLSLGSRKLWIQLIAYFCLFAPVSLLSTALAALPLHTHTHTHNTYLDNFILARRI